MLSPKLFWLDVMKRHRGIRIRPAPKELDETIAELFIPEWYVVHIEAMRIEGVETIAQVSINGRIREDRIGLERSENSSNVKILFGCPPTGSRGRG